MYNNYYNTSIFNSTLRKGNDDDEREIDTPTLLSYSAYMEYEHQFKQTFTETIELKKLLDSIVFSSIETDNETEAHSDEQQLVSVAETSLEPSPIQSDDEIEFSPSTSISALPLPLPDEEPAIDPETSELQTALDKLKSVADTRDDINEFILYLCERYNIDPNEQLNDLPFEVIDEIMTYIDYDPDNDGEFNFGFGTSNSNSSSDQLIIPANRIDEFRSLLSQFAEHVNRLSRLYRINGITDSRYDSLYHKFQQLFKPTVEPLIRLYKHAIRDYDEILSDSVRYHQSNLASNIDFDFEYDDYDY